MKKEKWIWLPHSAHLIVGDKCQFHLATYVGKYIVSTIGEYWAEQEVRRIHAKIHNEKWYEENKELKGDYFDNAYMKEFGYEEIGCGRIYETMVFKAKKSKFRCCPFVIQSGEVDFKGYNNPKEAFNGHYKMCLKWSKK